MLIDSAQDNFEFLKNFCLPDCITLPGEDNVDTWDTRYHPELNEKGKAYLSIISANARILVIALANTILRTLIQLQK